MAGRCICILMLFGLAAASVTLAVEAGDVAHAVPEISALEPELESLY